MSEETPGNTGETTVSPVDTPALAPIVESKRIDAMDILRGFALLGILFMNVEWFGRPIAEIGTFDETLTGADHAVGWLVRALIEGKFYKMFALLFGMGFAVMLIRARDVGRPFGWWFTRRMVVLFLIGMLHMIFIWPGDILHDYAFAGLVLLGLILIFQTNRLKKYDKPSTYLRIGLVWLSFPIVASTVAAIVFAVQYDPSKFADYWEEEQQVFTVVEERLALPAEETGDDQSADDDDAEDDEERELTPEEERQEKVDSIVESRRETEENGRQEVDAYTQPSYWGATSYRFGDAFFRLSFTPIFTFIILMPIYLLGYWMVASGVLRNHVENRHIFKPMAWIGSLFGLFFTVGSLLVIQHPVAEQSQVFLAAGNTMFYLGQYVLCAGYVGMIVLLIGDPKWQARFHLLAPMGRMALTNYIMQTAILSILFHGYGFGLWAQVSRAPQMLLVVVILLFQAVLSSWWLKRFRFGPLEWAWRSATYMSLQPMRI
jgi:uncharacterized protein